MPSPANSAPKPQTPAVITAVQRRELARMFERAKQLALAQPPDFRGAHQVLSECCTIDPGNTLFVQALLENLYRALLKTARAWPWQVWSLQAEFEKAVRERRYVEALAKGWALLGERPTLLSCLVKLAEVCDALDHLQTQSLLLETAHHLHPADAATAELYAKALASAGQFDQAARLRGESTRESDGAIPPQREASIADIERAVSESRWNEAFDMLVDLHGAEGANLRLRELGEEIELGKARQKHVLPTSRRRVNQFHGTSNSPTRCSLSNGELNSAWHSRGTSDTRPIPRLRGNWRSVCRESATSARPVDILRRCISGQIGRCGR